MRTKRQQGIALITALLVLLLVSAIVVGMSWMVMTDSRLGGNNNDRDKAFYGAEAGMEKMTTDVGNLFATQGALTAANIATITGTTPTISGITYQNLNGSTYQILCGNPLISPCVPASVNATILPPSPYAGMQGLITPFTLSVAAQTNDGAEIKLQRQVQAVAIPVFQFGIFSQTDLAFFNGPPFDFGGRVHTNGNLWLAANSGPLWLDDKVTVVGQVIRTNLENGLAIAGGGSYSGTVNIALIPGSPEATAADWRALALSEGSVSGTSSYGAVSSTLNNPDWNGTVVPAYNGELTNGVTPLNLTSTAIGGITQPISLIRRPIINEKATNLAEFNQQYFSEASLRILLDDYGPGGTPGAAGACNASDMMNLDTVTGTAPVDLATLAYDPTVAGAQAAPPAAEAWYAGAGVYPLPVSNGPAAGNAYNTYGPAGNPKDGYWQAKGKPIITGCIKIEYQGAPNVWTDVTNEILKQGLTGRNINPSNPAGSNATQLLYLPNTGNVAPAESATCGGATSLSEPSPNAIIRIARLRDNPSDAYPAPGTPCTPTPNGKDYWPMALYDTREGVSRDTALPDNPGDPNNTPEITAEGVINYIELDVNNLQRWFGGTIGLNGANATSVGGYAVYFSDRRGNLIDPTAGIKVGSFGFNDIVNVNDPANGCPNNTLEQGEDFEGDGVFRTYGGAPLSQLSASVLVNQEIQNLLGGTFPAVVLTPNPACGAVGVQPSPDYVYLHNQEARENPPVFFRRALKIEYGGSVNLGTACYGAAPNPPCGLTIASENPVYLQGDFNAPNNGTFAGFSLAASIAADSVTLLSDNWNDINSFISPYDPNSRPGTQTAYRTAVIAGKGIPFPQPAGSPQDYGTDGGVHNFLRYLEGWGGNLYYEGSLVSFYYNRQDIGLYKCCTTVYGPPTRVYSFDQNFTLGPQWLPPRTPSLRAVNTVGFSQEILPTQ